MGHPHRLELSSGSLQLATGFGAALHFQARSESSGSLMKWIFTSKTFFWEQQNSYSSKWVESDHMSFYKTYSLLKTSL